MKDLMAVIGLIVIVLLVIALALVVPVCIVVFLGWEYLFVYMLVCMVCKAIRGRR